MISDGRSSAQELIVKVCAGDGDPGERIVGCVSTH